MPNLQSMFIFFIFDSSLVIEELSEDVEFLVDENDELMIVDEVIPFDNQSEALPLKNVAASWCEKCNIRFGHTSSKTLHDRKIHGSSLKMFKCVHCEMQSLYVNNVLSHHVSKHKDLPKPSAHEVPYEDLGNSEECKLNRFFG